MFRIQLIAIIASLSFLFYIGSLIVRGRLREEYSIIWIVSTIVLLIFAFWRNGLEVMAHLMGVYEAPNLVFTAAIFAILIYLLHLSVMVSKLHAQNRALAQKVALLRQELKQEISKT